MSTASRRAWLSGTPLLFPGVCPVAAPGTTLLTGLSMGMVAACVLLASAITAGAVRRLTVPVMRVPTLLVIAAFWATAADLALSAWLYPLRLVLGIYVPLLAMNCLVLSALEEEGMQNGSGRALVRQAFLALAILCLVTAAGALREVLAGGALLQDLHRLTAAASSRETGAGLALFAAAPGAFFILAALAAFLQALAPRAPGAGYVPRTMP